MIKTEFQYRISNSIDTYAHIYMRKYCNVCTYPKHTNSFLLNFIAHTETSAKYQARLTNDSSPPPVLSTYNHLVPISLALLSLGQKQWKSEQGKCTLIDSSQWTIIQQEEMLSQ